MWRQPRLPVGKRNSERSQGTPFALTTKHLIDSVFQKEEIDYLKRLRYQCDLDISPKSTRM